MRYRKRDWQEELIKENQNKHVFYDFKFLEDKINSSKNNNLEIGVGKGDFIINKAISDNEANYFAVERITSVFSMCLKKLIQNDLKNVFLLNIDASKINEADFLESKFSKIFLNFSDPWPKKRHERRRLTSPFFLRVYKKILVEKGQVIMKTDNIDLFKYSLQTLRENGFILENIDFDYNIELNNEDFMSEYEKKFRDKGIKINRVVATKG